MTSWSPTNIGSATPLTEALMAGLITVSRSVGRGGTNLAPDVAKVGDALTQIGPDNGGVYGPPLSNEGLAQAIQQFQRFHKLSPDGRIDPGGGTLRKMNSIINPGLQQPGPAPKSGPKPTGSSTVKRIAPPDGRPDKFALKTNVPLESSFLTEVEFEWEPVVGTGTIQFFEVDDNVVPNWLAAVIPAGARPTGDVNIFFHPTPHQAGYNDRNYPSKAGWSPLYHYTNGALASQFSAAKTGQILIIPLMTESSSGDCGVLPARWESIIGQMLGLIAAGPSAQTAPAMSVTSVVVSSFSSGIAYSAAFRGRAGLGSRLRGVIDIDGAISTFSHHSHSLPPSAIKIWQTGSTAQSLKAQAMQNLFPIGQNRWGKFTGGAPVPKNPKAAISTIHAYASQTMMYFAAGRTRR
jgi:hypothetical protein